MLNMVFSPLTRFPTPCTRLPMSSEKAVVQVPLSDPRISCEYPWVFPVAGSSTPWKSTAPSPTVSTVWLACARDCRGYLWGGLRAGGSTLGVGSGGGLGGRHGGTVGGNLGGAWGSVLCCSLGICTFARVRLGGGVGLGGCAPVAANMSASFRMASMIWAPKRAKGTTVAGFVRASARRLAAYVAVLADDMYVMAPLCGKNWTVLVMRSPHVSVI